MRVFFYLLLVILGLHAVKGQEVNDVPGLLNEFRAATADTMRASLLAQISFNLIHTNPDSARLTGEQALSLAGRIKDRKGLADAHHSLGWLALTYGNFDSAEVHMQKALKLSEHIGHPKDMAPALSNLGTLAERRGDDVGALKYYLEALKMAEAAQDSSSVASLQHSIGCGYRKMGDYTRALSFLKEALAMARALKRPNNEATCLTALANVYNQQGDATRAMENYERAAEIYAVAGSHRQLGLVQENIGTLFGETEPERALFHYKLALAQYNAADSREDKAYIMRSIGLVQLRLGQLAAARQMLDTGSMLAVEIGASRLQMFYERNLGELSAKQGNAEATMAHYEKYLWLKDSLQGEDTQRELSRLRTAFDTERKEKDNDLLRAMNSEQNQRLRNRNTQLYGTIVIGLLAIIAALLFRYNYQQKRKHADTLEHLNGQLENSNAEISEINDLLEMRVLRSQMNPHFIYNCLNSAAQMTKVGNMDEAHTYLQSFARLLRTILDQSVKDLVPIEEVADFLRQYLDLETHRLPGLRYTIRVDDELLEDEAEIPSLLVQPFVENSVWHGLTAKEGERTLDVHFMAEEDRVVCTITDNGVGRERAAVSTKGRNGHRSLGMELTNERLRLLSRRMRDEGSITIEDLVDHAGEPSGTRVTLRI